MIVATNRFVVNPGHEEAFEERWRQRKSYLSENWGFVKFELLKTKMAGKIEKTEYLSTSYWVDLSAFEGWMKNSMAKGHSSQGPMPQGMLQGPPEFRIYETLLSEGHGHRTDYRSPWMDHVIEKNFAKESTAQAQIPVRSKEAGLPPIQIGPLEGRLLEILLRSAKAQRGVEIGTLGGYSTTWIAQALGLNGKIWTIEKSPQHAQVARFNLQNAGLQDRVTVLEGAAIEVLPTLESEGPFDFVFIDANKSDCGKYAEWAVRNLKVGGLLLADNAFIWGGMNYFGKSAGEITYPKEGLHSFNKSEFQGMSSCWTLLSTHPNLVSIILPTGEGLGIGVKVEPNHRT